MKTGMGHGQAMVQHGLTVPDINLPSGRPSQDFYLLAPHNFGKGLHIYMVVKILYNNIMFVM